MVDASLPEGFPRTCRLRRRSEYKATYAAGRKLHGNAVVVFVRPGQPGPGRFGITVTRRAGCAVVRNRLKRQVRDVLRRFADRARLSGLDVVVNVRDGAAGTEYTVLRADLERLLARVLRSGA